ncbi:MAG: hypothetical protein K8S94_00305 [Planctomycetia bacterium]|nr:hypothetical protein [Planctomycetia bacterium]
MSTATLRSRPSRDVSRDSDGPGWALWLGLLALFAVAALLLAWFFGWLSFGTDPRVAEIQKLQEEARQQFAVNGGPTTVAEATAAVTAMNTIRAKVEALPPDLRSQAERQGGGVFRSAMQARITSYFALPPEKRQAELDRQINQEEMMRKAFEAGRAVAGVLGGGQGAGQPGGSSGTQPAGPPGMRSGSEEDRNKWRKSMIDRTTPEERARYVEYRRAMDERREQRGLPSGWGR